MNIVLLIKDFAVGKKFDKSGMPNQRIQVKIFK